MEKEVPWEVITKIQFSKFCWISNFDGKGNSKSSQNDALSEFGYIFWNVYGFGQDWFVFCVRKKVWPKSQTNQLVGNMMGPIGWLLTPFEIQPGPLYWQILADSVSLIWQRLTLAGVDEFWIILDFEMGPKSNVFKENQHKIKKDEVQEGVLKKIWFWDWFLIPSWEALGFQNKHFGWYLLKYEVSVLRGKASKMSCKKIPNWSQDRARELTFWVVGRLFGRSHFWLLFDRQQKQLKVEESKRRREKRVSPNQGRRDGRGLAEAFGVIESQQDLQKRSATPCAPGSKGRRIEINGNCTTLPADPNA